MKNFKTLILLVFTLALTACTNLKPKEVLASLDNTYSIEQDYKEDLPTPSGKVLYFEKYLLLGTENSKKIENFEKIVYTPEGKDNPDFKQEVRLYAVIYNGLDEIVKVVSKIPLINLKTGETDYLTNVQFIAPHGKATVNKIFNIDQTLINSKIDPRMTITTVYAGSRILDSSEPEIYNKLIYVPDFNSAK